MSDLTEKKCVPCEGGARPLTSDEASKLLADIDRWDINSDAREISRTFKFKNYYATIAFVNSVAWIAHQDDHHPDMEVSYNTCHIHYSTHAIGGLSENDFIFAAKINALIKDE